MGKMHTMLSLLGINAMETIAINIHEVAIETMIGIEKKFKVKPRYETVDDNPNESYSVIELEAGNITLTFFSQHLVKPEGEQ